METERLVLRRWEESDARRTDAGMVDRIDG